MNNIISDSVVSKDHCIAGIRRRVFAFFIDFILISLLTVIVCGGQEYSLSANYSSTGWEFQFINGLQFIFVFITYFVLSEATLHNSLGKKLLGLQIKIVETKFSPIVVTILRSVSKLVELMTFNFTFLVFSKNKRTLTDLLVGTLVVKKKCAEEDKKELTVGIGRKILGVVGFIGGLSIVLGILYHLPSIFVVNNEVQQVLPVISEAMKKKDRTVLDAVASEGLKNEVSEEEFTAFAEELESQGKHVPAEATPFFWKFVDNKVITSVRSSEGKVFRVTLEKEDKEWKLYHFTAE